MTLQSLKHFPILVRYFDSFEVAQIKLLEIHSVLGETSVLICDYLLDVIKVNKLTDKIVRFVPTTTTTLTVQLEEDKTMSFLKRNSYQ